MSAHKHIKEEIAVVFRRSSINEREQHSFFLIPSTLNCFKANDHPPMAMQAFLGLHLLKPEVFMMRHLQLFVKVRVGFKMELL